MIHNYYKLFQTIFFHVWGVILKKKSSEWVIYGPHIHVKCLLKALDIFIYSQMRFQLYQVHIKTVIGLKSGKKSINWGSVAI